MENTRTIMYIYIYICGTLTYNANRKKKQNINKNCYNHIHNGTIGNCLEKQSNNFLNEIQPLQFLNSINSFI